MATTDQRAHMRALMQYLLGRKTQVHYTQARPMHTVESFPYEQQLATYLGGGGVVSPDCSEIVTLICKYAGLQDPNGLGYNGDGNTMTMYGHLKHYASPGQAHVGALVVFGAPTQPLSNQHVAMVLEPGTDPLLFSHGSSAGPQQFRLSVYEAAEPTQRPVTLLDIGTL